MQRMLKGLFAGALVLVLAGQGCGSVTKGLSPEAQRASQPVTLNIWGVADDFDVYEDAFNQYRLEHPNVSFQYRRLRLEEYETDLVDALAEDRGPDIFLIHNTWTDKYLTKTVPMPTVTNVAYSTITGTIKKERTWEVRREPTITLRAYKEAFADVAVKDTVRTVNVSTQTNKTDFQERLMGVPVTVDTLALYYNKDLLNAAGIPNPPEQWGPFVEQVKKLTKLDAQGKLVQAAAGIGTAGNIDRAVDLVSVLMLQNGAEMADEGGYPRFQAIPAELSTLRSEPPAWQALAFYTDFANPGKDTYTWDENQPNSLDAFIQGRTAFFFGYAYHLPIVQSRAPKLNLGITALPQIEGSPIKNYANYWYLTVSRKSKNQDVAWNFLNSLTKPELAVKVLDKAKRPAARKSLLAAQLEDESVGVFASQVLTATSWYRGKNPQAMEEAFLTMISDVVAGRLDVGRAVRIASDKVGQTIGR